MFDFPEETSNMQQLVEALKEIVSDTNIDTKTRLSQKAIEDISFIRAALKKAEGVPFAAVSTEYILSYQKLSNSFNGESQQRYLEGIKMLQDTFKSISVWQEKQREQGKWIQ